MKFQKSTGQPKNSQQTTRAPTAQFPKYMGRTNGTTQEEKPTHKSPNMVGNEVTFNQGIMYVC